PLTHLTQSIPICNTRYPITPACPLQTPTRRHHKSPSPTPPNSETDTETSIDRQRTLATAHPVPPAISPSYFSHSSSWSTEDENEIFRSRRRISRTRNKFFCSRTLRRAPQGSSPWTSFADFLSRALLQPSPLRARTV